MERVTPTSMHGKYINCYIDHLRRYVNSIKYADNKNILDVACGTGYGMFLLSSIAKKVTGIDISKEALDYASNIRYFCPVEFIKLDLNKDRISGKYDYIVSFETIEHLEKPEFFMNQINDLLTDCGVFHFSIPVGNYNDPIHKQTYNTVPDVLDFVNEFYFDGDFIGRQTDVQEGKNGNNLFVIGTWRKGIGWV